MADLDSTIRQLLDNLAADIRMYEPGFRQWEQKYETLLKNHTKLQNQAMKVRSVIGFDKWDEIVGESND